MKKFFAKLYIWVLLVVLYAPLVFIAVFSFTESKVLGSWEGFSTDLYRNLLTGQMQGNASLLAAVKNTVLIALVAAAFSTLLGTVAAIGIHNMKGRAKKAVAKTSLLKPQTSFFGKSCNLCVWRRVFAGTFITGFGFSEQILFFVSLPQIKTCIRVGRINVYNSY